MITFQEEVVSYELYDECKEMFQENKEETSSLNSLLDIDVLMFIRMYRIGSLVFLSIRDDGKIIGYSMFQLAAHLHDQLPTAQTNLLYITPRFRKGLLGVKFIKFCESYLKDIGIKRIFQTTTVHRELGKLFERLGYAPCEISYLKEI